MPDNQKRGASSRPGTALITGGTGFLGKHLADRLTSEGRAVRSLDMRRGRDTGTSITFLLGDIRDARKVDEAVAGCDVVFHLASIPSIARARYEDYHQINVGGTRNVLEAARRHAVSTVVHVSSSTVYGVPKAFPLTEADVGDTVGKYGRSKLAAEQVCRDYAGATLSVQIIRPRVILGAGRIGIFSLLFEAVLGGRPVYLLGGGRNVFQFTGVSDMVEAMVLAAASESSDVYNIGAEDRTVVADVMRALIDHAGSTSRIVRLPARLVRGALRIADLFGMSPLMNEQFQIADKDFMLDTEKARRALGWRPKQTNTDCLLEAFDWYNANHAAAAGQFARSLGVLGRFVHSRQGAFQENDEGGSA